MTSPVAMARAVGLWRAAIGRAVAPLTMAALMAAVTACGVPRGGAALLEEGEPASAASRWPIVLISAQSDVDQARHGDADRRLREFAAEYAQTAEALESIYWRAGFMLDPTNATATPREAADLLERYLAATSPLVHRAEATVFQRLAKNLATPREGQPSAPASARTTDPAREAEIKALKEELEATKAELERIRKRVAPPPTTPPPQLPDAE